MNIRLVAGNDPDTQEPCQVIEINGQIVPYWLDHKTIQRIKDIKDSSKLDKVLLQIQDQFMAVIRSTTGQHLMTFSQFLQALESGSVRSN